MRDSVLRAAKVVGVHPEGYAVDIVFVDTGARANWVQVLAVGASTNTGLMDMPEPAKPAGAYGMTDSKDRDVYALVGLVGGGVPIVLGFLYPQVCQMLFRDMNRKIERHASDWYTSVDGAGNFEACHPSGTYFRIGGTAAHEDLTGEDFDGKWAITKNTDAAVHVHLSVKNAGVEKASVSIDPAGNIAIQADGTTSLNSAGAVTVTAPTVTIDAPSSTFTGTVLIEGHLTFEDGATGVGTVSVSSGDVTADGKSLKTHTHSGVTAGGANTGAPV